MLLCRELKLFTQAVVAIDGSKFKARQRPRNATTHRARLNDPSVNLKKASSAISMHWRRQIERSPM
jgi:hypothetical protein